MPAVDRRGAQGRGSLKFHDIMSRGLAFNQCDWLRSAALSCPPEDFFERIDAVGKASHADRLVRRHVRADRADIVVWRRPCRRRHGQRRLGDCRGGDRAGRRSGDCRRRLVAFVRPRAAALGLALRRTSFRPRGRQCAVAARSDRWRFHRRPLPRAARRPRHARRRERDRRRADAGNEPARLCDHRPYSSDLHGWQRTGGLAARRRRCAGAAGARRLRAGAGRVRATARQEGAVDCLPAIASGWCSARSTSCLRSSMRSIPTVSV